jgi:succinyl-CoA synthetase alpha subunit
MSILVDRTTRVLVQGITGSEGSFHTSRMVEYGTNVVAGVTPGKGGNSHEGIPIFNTVQQAVRETGANVSAIFVRPAYAADAIMEASDAGVAIVVCLTEGIPILDVVAARSYLDQHGTRLLGPNTSGIISPGQCKIGVMAGYIHRQGSIGVVSRSGTLTYEVVYQLTQRGMGQSTCVGIGGDPIVGLSFVDLLSLFQDDPETEAVIMIGEIGGRQEEDAAEFFRAHMTKPVVAFVAGMTAPPERRMGHAGAIVSGGQGGAKEKIRALEEAGVVVARNPADVGSTVAEVLSRRDRDDTTGK